MPPAFLAFAKNVLLRPLLSKTLDGTNHRNRSANDRADADDDACFKFFPRWFGCMRCLIVFKELLEGRRRLDFENLRCILMHFFSTFDTTR